MADIEPSIDDINEYIDSVACDTSRFNQEESAEIYDEVAAHCREWSNLIRSEMDSDPNQEKLDFEPEA